MEGGEQALLKDKSRSYEPPNRNVHSIQNALPSGKLYESGMMKIGRFYTATFRMKDVDFLSGSDEDQEEFFKMYSEILNSLDSRSSFKITLFNRNMNYQKTDFILLPTDYNDGFDQLRREYNSMRRNNRAKAMGIVQERYITVTTEKKNEEIAEQFFDRFGQDFSRRLKRLQSAVTRLSARERMELLYDFYQAGAESYFDFDLEAAKRRHTSWKDYVCPHRLQFKRFHFNIQKRHGRVLFLRDWGRTLKVETISRLMEVKTNMMVSVDIIPLSADSIWKFLEDSEMSSESNLDRWQRRSGAERRRFSLPPLRFQRDQQVVSTYSEDVDERNQRIFLANVSLAFQADSMSEMEMISDSLEETAKECGGQLQVLGFQQMEGLNTVLPYGPRFVQNLRDVTTENLAVMMPFNNVAINHITGIPYGVHEDTKQEMLIDRRLLMNGNEWVLGVSGSGKSMRVKITAILEFLLTRGDIIFVDPHGEYGHVTRAMGGQVITLGASSGDVINALDMCQGYGDGNDLRRKMEFVVALLHAALGPEFTKAMEAIVMRCCQRVYHTYLSRGYQGDPPTLKDLHLEMAKQKEEAAQTLALLMEPMLIGPMSCFNGLSNVDIFRRITCFDISHMDQSIWDAGMTVIMDTIQNRLVLNFAAGTPTYIKIDEVGRFLNDPYLSHLFERFYSESRKYGGYITGIVQNVNKLLHTEAARNMLSNSEIVVMFRQSQIDAPLLQNLYDLSKSQSDRLQKAEGGCGLFKCGTQMINFDGRIEKGYIYDLANTKPNHEFNTTP